MDFDHVIVGGGSGGATPASRLSEDPQTTVSMRVPPIRAQAQVARRGSAERSRSALGAADRPAVPRRSGRHGDDAQGRPQDARDPAVHRLRALPAPGGNTNAPTIVIAERAADWMRQAQTERG